MGPVNVVLLVIGALLTASGIARARGPWSRYQALRRQDANVARYEAWRGGLRDAGPTGASAETAALRRQARDGALIAGAGIVIALVGLFLP